MVRIKIGFWIIFLALLLPGSVLGEEGPDFRGIRWGMGRVSVMAAEKAVPEPVAGPYLSYRLWFFEREVFLRYRFVKNYLVEARYVFFVRDAEDLRTLSGFLEDKYGSAVVSSGPSEVSGLMEWKTPETRIRMEMAAGGQARIVYTGEKIGTWLQGHKKNTVQKEYARMLDLL